MKKGKKQIYISNRWIYTFIALGILAIVSVGAAIYTASGTGHPYTEISTCSANQVLKMNSAGTGWTCGTDELGGGGITVETDPTVISWVKDGVSFTEISDRPAGLDDGDQIGIRGVRFSSRTVSCYIPSEGSVNSCDAVCPSGTILAGCSAGSYVGFKGAVPEVDGSNNYCRCTRSSLVKPALTCYAVCLEVST